MAAMVSMWGESGPRPEPDHRFDEPLSRVVGRASIKVDCPRDRAWDLVSDVTRIGEFSPECVDAWWVDGYPARALGGRFEGRNRSADGKLEWIRPCDVVEWDPPHRIAWTAGDKWDGTPATRWTYTIEPDGSGVTITEEFAHLPEGMTGVRMAMVADPDRAEEIVTLRTAALVDGAQQTLARMKAVLEAE